MLVWCVWWEERVLTQFTRNELFGRTGHWLTVSSRINMFLPVFVALCAAQNQPNKCNPLHTFRFSGSWKNVFVTKEARTWRSQSLRELGSIILDIISYEISYGILYVITFEMTLRRWFRDDYVRNHLRNIISYRKYHTKWCPIWYSQAFVGHNR